MNIWYWANLVIIVLIACLVILGLIVNRRLPNRWTLGGIVCLGVSFVLTWLVEPRVYPHDVVTLSVVIATIAGALIARGARSSQEEPSRLAEMERELHARVVERRREKLRRQGGDES